MSLLSLQKAERRARILVETRRLMATRGWSGLTMRELARASRVSVPTVYNLVGGKDALLGALMEDIFAQVSEVGLVSDGSLVTRAGSLWRAGLAPLLEAPEYARELVCLFASSMGPNDIRREHGDRYVALMAAVLESGQLAGDLSTLVAPTSLARTMYSLWIAQMLRWAHGELDDDGLRAAHERGLSLLLLGVARGAAQRELIAIVESIEAEDVSANADLESEVAASCP